MGYRIISKLVFAMFVIGSSVGHADKFSSQPEITINGNAVDFSADSSKIFAERRECNVQRPFCFDDLVITRNAVVGQITAIFEEGRIAVSDFGAGSRIWSQSQVALTVACTRRFCTGDKIVTGDGRSGIIQGIFADGYLVIKHSADLKMTIWSPRNVGLSKASCEHNFVQRPGQCD